MRGEAPMTVRLREIPPEGLRLAFDLSGAWSEEVLAATDARLDAARLRANLVLNRSHHDVIAQGTLSGVLEVPCARCTAPARLAVDSPFHVTFVPAATEEDSSSEEIRLEESELDVATYADDMVDLAETLREQVLLALPIAQLCREDCRGLCPRCGTDLNVGACECPPQPEDERWAALRNVKPSKEL